MDEIDEMSITGPAAKRFFAPNQWPNEKNGLSNFRPSIEIYFNEMSKVAQKMFDLFSKVLQQNEEGTKGC